MGSVLETVNHVRLVVVTSGNKIPSWVEIVSKPESFCRSDSRPTSLFSEQGSFTVSSCVDELVEAGFALRSGHYFPFKGSPLAKAVFVFKSASSVDISPSEEKRLSELESLLSGKWFVRADQNGPIGEIRENHVVVKFQNQQGVGRNLMIPSFSITRMDARLPVRKAFSA